MFFYFLKIIFETSASKQSKTHKKLFFNKNKFEFLRNAVCTAFSNGVKEKKNIVLPKVFEIKKEVYEQEKAKIGFLLACKCF